MRDKIVVLSRSSKRDLELYMNERTSDLLEGISDHDQCSLILRNSVTVPNESFEPSL